MKVSLIQFHQYFIKQQLPFVSYAVPGNTTPVTYYTTRENLQLYPNTSAISCNKGFLMAPFEGEDYPVVVIPADESFSGWETEQNLIPEELEIPVISDNSHKKEYITTQSEYLQQVKQIKENLKQGKAQKVVLSRITEVAGFNPETIPYLFESLVNTYAYAFVYIIFIPGSGVWIGATPETLLETEHNRFKTIALAGTKSLLESAGNNGWSLKNLKEQEYVEAHLRQRLLAAGYEFEESERHTIKAGNVEHLGTIFTGETKSLANQWQTISQLLYPTPAICGTDNKTSLEIIKQVEKHQRAYYTGFLGPFDNTGNASLFINLRCMKIDSQKAYMYAGGGIISESVAEKEWDETEWKFRTLGEVIDSVTQTFKTSRNKSSSNNMEVPALWHDKHLDLNEQNRISKEKQAEA